MFRRTVIFRHGTLLAGLVALSFLGSGPLAAQSDPVDLSGPWFGAVGPSGALMPFEPDALPVEDWSYVEGSLRIRITRPNRRAPFGMFTARLRMLRDDRVIVFRGRAPVADDGVLSTELNGGGRNVSPVQLDLALAGDGDDFVKGSMQSGGDTFPVFAMARVFHRRWNPVPDEDLGVHTFFIVDQSAMTGTGVGVFRIRPNGNVRLAGNFENGRRFSRAFPLLERGGVPFVAAWMPAGRGEFFGGWLAKDLLETDSDWNGVGMNTNQPLSPLKLLAARYERPPRRSSPFDWEVANAFFQHPDSFVGTGEARFEPPRRFDVTLDDDAFLYKDPVLTLRPPNGLVRGVIGYSDFSSGIARRVRGRLSGAVNQKSGEILGSILPAGGNPASGIFDVVPNP